MQPANNQTKPSSSASSERTAELFAEHQNGIHKRTDRMFAGLMLFQWLAGIAAAIWISPRAWMGAQSHIHFHVFAAVVIGGAITSFPVWLAWKRPGHTITRHAIAIGQTLTSALLIHLTGGRIETHFHVFGSLAFLAIYRDWKVLVTATIVVAVDHFARGVFWPQSVFGVLTASHWRWVEHAGWVVFEDFFLMISIRQSLEEMRQVAQRQASLEHLNQGVERLVEQRTEALHLEIQERKRSETRLALQYEVTRTLKESQALEDAVPKVLRAICESIGWNFGALWRVDASAEVLRCVEVHHAPDAGLATFAGTTRELTFPKGISGPGRVWAGGEPAWIVDVQSDSNYPRSPQAVESGLHTALIFPIIAGSGLVGVFEFLSRERHERDENLLSLMSNLGRQVGLFLEHIEAEAELARTHKELLQVSRQAGMAEVATSVLHNVGNVLNSINVSASLASAQVKNSKTGLVGKVAALMRQHAADLGDFLTKDDKGRRLPSFLEDLAEELAKEGTSILAELGALVKNVDHVKDVVAMQQSYAKVSGVTETVKVTDLVEDALRMNASALIRHDLHLFREYDEHLPQITVEKHKVLQILVNLIRNAKQACDESGVEDKRLVLRVGAGGDRVRISLADNGVGIPAENLTRIFSHGFTTKKDGHGFGLHSGALAAREMGGVLSVHSDGPRQGAVFTLELPCQENKRI
jgi:signal transduction histidine kinase